MYWISRWLATQIFLEYFHPENFGEDGSNLTCAYFSNGLEVQPPPRQTLLVSCFYGEALGFFRNAQLKL